LAGRSSRNRESGTASPSERLPGRRVAVPPRTSVSVTIIWNEVLWEGGQSKPETSHGRERPRSVLSSLKKVGLGSNGAEPVFCLQVNKVGKGRQIHEANGSA